MAKILLVEDDPFLSSLLKNRLQKENYETVLASDGEAALNYLKNDNFDLVLLDIILPRKTGFEILEEINLDPRFQAKKTPVIVISNLGQAGDIKRGQELGIIEYLVKAKISIDDLMGKIKDFLKK
ncbi:response regulator [Candidatus Wolfebacteria bacterium]|nr:response regulator [Candidatus Wolfebacteria bacterium]